MDANIILSIITLIGITIVGVIQQQQIKSMKTLMDLYDINKLREYQKLANEIKDMELDLKVKEFGEVHLSEIEKIKTKLESMLTDYERLKKIYQDNENNKI